MSDSQISVALILKLVDRITGPFKPVLKQVDRLKRDLGGVRDAGALAGRGIATAAGGARTAAGIFAGFGGAALLATSQLVAPAAEFETFMAILTALEGTSEKAGAALSWVKDFATNTPLQMQGVLDAYQSLKTFGIDPTNGSLQALVDTNAKMGGDQYKLEGIILAVGQAWTKQKLQGEEALQLIERGVPVWDLLSQKMGKSAVEIQEMASAGKLGRAEIQLLIDAMGANAAGAAEAQMSTWKGMVSNLQDIWSNFQLSIMQNGLFDWMKGRLKEILDTVNQMAADGRLTSLAIEIGGNLKKTLQVIWDLATGFAQMLRDVFPYVEQAKEMLGGWNELALSLLALPFASSFLAMAQGVGMVGAAMLKLSFIFLSNPIMAAVAAIAGGVYLIYRNWDAIAGWFSEKFGRIKAAFKTGFIDGIIALWNEFAPINLIKDGFLGLFNWLTGYELEFEWSDLIPTLDWSSVSPPIHWGDTLDIQSPAFLLIHTKFISIKDAFKNSLIGGIITAWREFDLLSLVWDAFELLADWIQGYQLDFAWSDLLPDWSWSAIIPDLGAYIRSIASLGPTLPAPGGAPGPASRLDRGPFFAPARALGGSVTAGRLYQVNESRVEYFQPRVDGRIIPLINMPGMEGGGALPYPAPGGGAIPYPAPGGAGITANIIAAPPRPGRSEIAAPPAGFSAAGVTPGSGPTTPLARIVAALPELAQPGVSLRPGPAQPDRRDAGARRPGLRFAAPLATIIAALATPSQAGVALQPAPSQADRASATARGPAAAVAAPFTARFARIVAALPKLSQAGIVLQPAPSQADRASSAARSPAGASAAPLATIVAALPQPPEPGIVVVDERRSPVASAGNGAPGAFASRGGAAAAPRQGDVITVGDIHIHAQPGQNPEEIAREVRRQIISAGRGPDRALHDGGGS